VRIILFVLVGAWVARHLGPAQYGQLAYIVALVGVFQVAVGLGIDQIVVRDLARSPAAAAPILGTALRLRATAGIGGWALIIALTLLLRPGDDLALILAFVLGAGLVLQAAEVVDLWLASRTRSKIAVLPKLGAYTGAALLKVVLIVYEAPLWAFGAALLVETLLLTAALGWAYRMEPTADRWEWQSSRARDLVRQSMPLLLAGLSVVIYMRIDQVILRELAGEQELGLYSAILPFSQAWSMVPMALCASLLPRMSALKLEDPARYLVRLQQLFTSMLWIGVAAAAATTVLAPVIVPLLLGPAFKGAVAVLQWHAWTNVFVFLGVAQSVAIVNSDQLRMALIRTTYGATVSVSLGILLTPRWGSLGAAWAAIAAQCVAAVVSNAIHASDMFKLQVRALMPFRRDRLR